MVITELLERNARNSGGEIALVEFNPNLRSKKEDWKEFRLAEGGTDARLRRELTWGEFDAKANRVANYLLSTGVKKGDKVAILLMNCLEWLPIYFGVLKTGALAVPMNYRYTADEIRYCLELSDASVLIFGQEFISRVEENLPGLMEENGVSVIILTLGGDGSKCFFGGDSFEVKGYKVRSEDVKDTTGAGDAFWGAFLSRLLQLGVTTADGLTADVLKDAMDYGNISGSLCVREKGAISSLPDKDTIEAYRKNHTA